METPPGEAGHLWVGYDISPSMLKIAKSREVRPDFLAETGGKGFKFFFSSMDEKKIDQQI